MVAACGGCRRATARALDGNVAQRRRCTFARLRMRGFESTRKSSSSTSAHCGDRHRLSGKRTEGPSGGQSVDAVLVEQARPGRACRAPDHAPGRDVARAGTFGRGGGEGGGGSTTPRGDGYRPSGEVSTTTLPAELASTRAVAASRTSSSRCARNPPAGNKQRVGQADLERAGRRGRPIHAGARPAETTRPPRRREGLVEVPPGFEPGNGGFADHCLTTWLWHRVRGSLAHPGGFRKGDDGPFTRGGGEAGTRTDFRRRARSRRRRRPRAPR